MEQDCIFCQIVAGTSPASYFYEDALCLGFLDVSPVNSGHAIIVPKRHFRRICDLDEAIGSHLFTIGQRTALAMYQADLKCEGINFLLADGEAAFQEIDHVHLHVFPRYAGDSFTISADWSIRPPRSELDRVSIQIKDAYQKLYPPA